LPIAHLSTLQSVLVIGSNLRKEHPLFAQRLRQAIKLGGAVHVVTARGVDWAMPIANTCVAPAADWAQALADIAAAVAFEKKTVAPDNGQVTDVARAVAISLLEGERKAILLGNAAAHHPQASQLLALANWIGEHTGATVGYLTEAANTVGAQVVGAMPKAWGLNAGQMLSGALKAAILLNTEPQFDSAGGAAAMTALGQSKMVVTLSPFKANLDISDVLLPIAPFTETSGTFVNAEGRVQSFHAVVKPLGETRPAWKVFRALANVLDLPGFDSESSQEVLQLALADGAGVVPAYVSAAGLSNTNAQLAVVKTEWVEPCVASIYQLDGIVRRAPALQSTADAKVAETEVPA
jgi:NADH-quinone oxidoreductase subunit G